MALMQKMKEIMEIDGVMISSISHLLGSVHKPNWVKDFPVVGQGTLIFSIQRDTMFHIVIRPKLEHRERGADEWIALSIKEDSAEFSMYHDGKAKVLESVEGTVKNELVGYEPGCKISYWFSYNRDLLQLKYGKGYCMEETTLLTHDFLNGLSENEAKKVREDMQYLFSPFIRRRIEQYDKLPLKMMIQKYAGILKASGYKGEPVAKMLKTSSKASVDQECEALAKSMIDIEKEVAFEKHPFECNWSPFVLDSSKVNLYELDQNLHTFSASLPPACQELYANVTAPDVEIDWPYSTSKYRLSDAIRYSLKSGILKKKLDSKAGEFNKKDKKEDTMTYLRVTLGKNRGSSPGIPYVLEIWPSNHGSPIHNHGNAYAVIKVLHGGLTIKVFNRHTDKPDAKHLLKFDVKKGDCTWISPNWFQTHQLWNSTDDYCATIQCYQYGDNDTTQWPYFDYVASTKVIDEFLPDSDYTFHEMQEKVMKEYAQHMTKQEEQRT